MGVIFLVDEDYKPIWNCGGPTLYEPRPPGIVLQSFPGLIFHHRGGHTDLVQCDPYSLVDLRSKMI